MRGADADAATFDRWIAAGGREHWERAAELYRGELLPGCDAEPLNRERQERAQAYLNALENLAADALPADPAAAIRWLRRLLAADPLREIALRDLMRALALRGELAAITEAYRDFRLYLRRELNADPAPETVALYRELSLPERSALSAAFPDAAARNIRRLPAALSRLIGRDEEIAAVGNALKIARLLTLTGAGGMGKTRMALAVAEAANDFPGGIWFLDLAPLTESAAVLPAIAAALEVSAQAGQAPRDALISFLAPRHALLIFDNCEHLIAVCAEMAQSLLSRCSHLKILATSRQPLGIMGEALRQVPPLTAPPEIPARRGIPDAEFLKLLRENAAVQLFSERARLARPDFELKTENAAAVAQICRQLDGLPLALELAAARMAALSPDEIAARLEDRFRLLSAGNRGAMPRHQNLDGAAGLVIRSADGGRAGAFPAACAFCGRVVAGVRRNGMRREIRTVGKSNRQTWFMCWRVWRKNRWSL